MSKRKRKGKSDRRIKHWHKRYQAGEDVEQHAERGRKHTQRAVKLPPSRLAAPEENLDQMPKAEGLVTAMYRRGVLVRVEGH